LVPDQLAELKMHYKNPLVLERNIFSYLLAGALGFPDCCARAQPASIKNEDWRCPEVGIFSAEVPGEMLATIISKDPFRSGNPLVEETAQVNLIENALALNVILAIRGELDPNLGNMNVDLQKGTLSSYDADFSFGPHETCASLRQNFDQAIVLPQFSTRRLKEAISNFNAGHFAEDMERAGFPAYQIAGMMRRAGEVKAHYDKITGDDIISLLDHDELCARTRNLLSELEGGPVEKALDGATKPEQKRPVDPWFRTALQIATHGTASKANSPQSDPGKKEE
jgi:hypothetical protein